VVVASKGKQSSFGAAALDRFVVLLLAMTKLATSPIEIRCGSRYLRRGALRVRP